jgi:hypothetical protein
MAYAENHNFTAESFIPERFSDLEWRINGSFDLSGSDYESEIGHPPSSYRRYEWAERESDGGGLSLGSRLHRRFVTIPRFVDFSLDLAADYRHSTNSLDQRLDYDDISESHNLADNTNKSYRTNLRALIDAGAYVVSDLFMSLRTDARTTYREDPGSDGLQVYRYIYTGVDSIREVHSEEVSERRSDDRVNELDMGILPGWGRVYSGDYAVTALYMIDELKKENLIVTEPTFRQMRALAEKIYYYRLKHPLDTRLHRIEALTHILQYLHAEGIIDDPGPHGHVLIADVWDYFPGGRSSIKSSRQFGYRIRGGVGVRYWHSSRQLTRLSENTNLETRYPVDDPAAIDTLYNNHYHTHRYDYDRTTSRESYITGLLEYYKPINLRCQLDLVAEARYIVDSYRSTFDQEVYYDSTNTVYAFDRRLDIEDQYSFSVSATGRYILDSRTDLSLNGNLSYSHHTNNETSVWTAPGAVSILRESTTHENWDYSLVARANYRIAIPTTIVLTASYNKGIDAVRPRPNETTTDRSSYRVNLGVSHYFL